MSKRLVGVAGICLGVFVSLMWQQVGQTAPALTALDYEEIRQLYARYNVTWDAALGDDGDMWARTFTEDGVMGSTNSGEPPKVGYEELKAHANKTRRNPVHYTTSVLIEPTAEGAMGMTYLLLVLDDADKPLNQMGQLFPRVATKGVYHDQLVKTPEGWRFKKRMVTFGTFSEELRQALAQ